MMIKGQFSKKKCIDVPNVGVPKIYQNILLGLKREIDSNTIIVENINTPLSAMDR
jgi:hypothetical protein